MLRECVEVGEFATSGDLLKQHHLRPEGGGQSGRNLSVPVPSGPWAGLSLVPPLALVPSSVESLLTSRLALVHLSSATQQLGGETMRPPHVQVRGHCRQKQRMQVRRRSSPESTGLNQRRRGRDPLFPNSKQSILKLYHDAACWLPAAQLVSPSPSMLANGRGVKGDICHFGSILSR